MHDRDSYHGEVAETVYVVLPELCGSGRLTRKDQVCVEATVVRAIALQEAVKGKRAVLFGMGYGYHPRTKSSVDQAVAVELAQHWCGSLPVVEEVNMQPWTPRGDVLRALRFVRKRGARVVLIGRGSVIRRAQRIAKRYLGERYRLWVGDRLIVFHHTKNLAERVVWGSQDLLAESV